MDVVDGKGCDCDRMMVLELGQECIEVLVGMRQELEMELEMGLVLEDCWMVEMLEIVKVKDVGNGND